MIVYRWNNLLSERAMGACQKQKSAAIGAPLPEHIGLFPGSSVVEQLTVNQLVGGSNPSRGAIFLAKKLKLPCSGTIRSDDAAVPQAENGYTF